MCNLYLKFFYINGHTMVMVDLQLTQHASVKTTFTLLLNLVHWLMLKCCAPLCISAVEYTYQFRFATVFGVRAFMYSFKCVFF